MDSSGSQVFPTSSLNESFGGIRTRATTLGTVVVRGGPIQMVIAILQSFNKIYIKVVEIEPKLTTLGENIEEAVALQKQHDELMQQLQNMPTPIEEFIRKADKLLSNQEINSEIVDAMGNTLNIVWEDILKLVHDRKHLLDLCANFHEKMGSCRGKMAALEVACNDTMIPIEVIAVQDFLQKFKHLRIDVLTTIMSALKEGNELLAPLQKLANSENFDSRPDHIKRDALRSVTQVQHWLESLHDRRNMLEAAWQTRKTQLEQCLALAILAKDLDELEKILNKCRNHISGVFSLGECEHTSSLKQNEYNGLKHDALLLRDRALKITRATEKLVTSACFAGDEACSRAYHVLNMCTEYLELIDQRMHWLNQSKDFFSKADKILVIFENLEIQLAQVKLPSNSLESFAMYAKILRDVKAFTEEPLRLGFLLLDEVGRTKPDTVGVKRVLDEIENRKVYIESMCSSSNEEQIRVQQNVTKFFEQYNEILSWLLKITEHFLRGNVSMGKTSQQSQQFLFEHHKLMQEVENKGELINDLLENMKRHLESLSPQQRYDVDSKAEDLHSHWIELKDVVLKRVDLVTIYIEFLNNADKLNERFHQLDDDFKQTPEETKLNYLESEWKNIKETYGNLKSIGSQILNTKITDPYLETKSAFSNIEEILKSFSNRQFDLTSNWEKYTTKIFEKKEIEIILEKIMNDNIDINNKTTKLDTQLYPVFTPPTEDPIHLRSSTNDKLSNVLQDIVTAQNEIQERIDTTLSIQTNDIEYREKINQVLENLRSLNDKLNNIKFDYKALLENLLNFLENIIKLKEQIDEYFRKNIIDRNYERNLLAEHEKYREDIMVKFRTLISQSELIIERVRILEPNSIKEHDTDRILKLLENLRNHFELNNSMRMNKLEKLQIYNNFQIDFNEINKNLENVCQQLNVIKTQNVENLANAKTTSLAFEYFERTIELLETRINTFINSSESLYTTNPDCEKSVRNDLEQLRTNWEQFKEQVKLTRNSLNLANEYFELIEKIDCQYREINYFYSSVTNKIQFLREPVQAENLVNDIETYVHDRDGPLNKKLHRASQLSMQIYNENRMDKMQNDVNALFQSFSNLKIEILSVSDRLKNEEKIKEQQHEQQLLQQQQIEIQKQQQIHLQHQIEQQQHLLQQQRDEIDRANVAAMNNIKIINKTEVKENFSEIKYIAPNFVQPLRDSTIGEGEQFTFECQIIGYPEPRIEWYKDGILIQNNSDYKIQNSNSLCILQIDETFQADSARFMCRASNLVGIADSVATLKVHETAAEAKMTPPQIIKFLESGVAREGSSHKFNCLVDGNPLPTVQWFKNDKCIDDSVDYAISYNNGEAILKLDEVFLEDNAVYTVNVANPIGFAQCSANLIVEPLEPTEVPRFKLPLSNVMARVGQKIRLDCAVTGIPKPELYWTQNGKPFHGREVQYDDGHVTLVIPAAYPKDTGIYICTAKNLAGETYSSCNVSVKGRLPNETSDSEMASDLELIKPSVQLPLKHVSIFEGKSVRLDCVIVGQPEPEVIWYHNERPVKESPDVQLLFQGDRCSLVIHEAFTEDAGAYKVVAINSAGEASSSCNLTVTPLNIAEPATRLQNDRQQSNDLAPKFEKFLSDVLAAEGDTIELECTAIGDQPLTAKWYLSNKEITESDRFKFISNNKNGIFKLVLENVLSDDKGVYTVKITNNSGNAKCFSHLIVKSVNVPDNNNQLSQMQIEEKQICPTFKELFTDKNVHQGDVVKFECIVVGKPTPKIKWFFNSQPVHGKHFLISTSGNRQVLTITEASPETVGKISCVAENDVGKATCVSSINLICDGTFPSSANIQSETQEHNTESSRVTIKKQTFTTTSTSQVNSYEGNLPQSEIHSASSHYDQSLKEFNEQKPEVVESHHYQEFHKTTDIPNTIQQKSALHIQKTEEKSSIPIPQKSTRKTIAPRFTTPLVGKIVDQGAIVNLEAIYDGFPSPEIKVLKNGEEILGNDKIKISNKFHKVNIDLINVNTLDAGRYSVTASNTAGQSTSTADVVVKKTIFPPVFGHRLQAQVAKRGERVVMEVEVSGTPDPTVTWYKDNKPIKDILSPSTYKLKSEGNTYTLIIDTAESSLSGKFMVRATNAGGEAQSIADFVVLEPTPERMMEIVKTTVYNANKNNLQNQTLNAEPFSFKNEKTEHTTEEDLHGTSESKIVTEHRCTTEATMRLEHKPTYFDMPTLINKPIATSHQAIISTNIEIPMETVNVPKPMEIFPATVSGEEEFNNKIESTSISKKSSFEFFKKIQSEPQKPTAIPVSIQSHGTPSLMQNSEIHKKLDEMQKSVLSTPKILPIHLESLTPMLSEADMIKLNLTPGTPPEMDFIPMPEMHKPQVYHKVINSEESHQHKPIVNVLSSTILITPQVCKKEEYISSTNFIKESKFESSTSNGPIYRPQALIPNPITEHLNRAPSPKPSAEGVAMEKLWNPKPVEYESGFSEFEETKGLTYTSCSENEPESLPLDPPKSIKDTKKIFEEKIQEVEKHIYIPPMKTSIDLIAPSLVKLTLPKLTESQKPSKSFLDDIILEPGTPPVMCYAPKPERKQSLVEAMEQSLELDLQRGPSKVLPHSFPTIAPPLPPKDFQIIAPVVPTKSSPIFETQKKSKPPPPVVPPKLTKVEFWETDIESDRWKHSESESDEPFIKSMKHSTFNTAETQKSIAESLPTKPSVFGPKVSGYAADTEESVFHKFESHTSNVQESRQIFESKNFSEHQHEQHFETKPDFSLMFPNKEMKGQKTIARNITMNATDYKIREEPQFEHIQFKAEQDKPKVAKIPPPPSPSKYIKSEYRESDYSSGHDERIHKIWQTNESDSEIKGYRSVQPVATPTIGGRQSTLSDGVKSPATLVQFDKMPKFNGPINHEHIIKVQTTQSPHVFKPKPVTPTQKQYQSQIQKITHTPTKEVSTQYYTGVAGAPLHLASTATETRNTMQMKESSETCRRIVNMEQTKKVIHFDQNKTILEEKVLEPFLCSPTKNNHTQYHQNIPPPPTPTKFIKGEFRESDYENEIENARITPLWNSNGEPRYRHVEPPRPGRSASVPRSYERILSPMQFDRGPEMPTKITIENSRNLSNQENLSSSNSNSYQTQTLNRYSSTSNKSKSYFQQNTTRDDMNLKVGSPPKYGFITEKAQAQANDIGSSFRQKSTKFINDISEDFKRTQDVRPAFKRAPSEGANEPKAYRDESRISEYGTKCVDPNTGLIYFKYDFGYEFGILFPGEGKKFIGAANNKKFSSISDKPLKAINQPSIVSNTKKFPLKQSGDIVIPVEHVRSVPANNQKRFMNRQSPYTEPEFFDGPTGIKNKRYSLPLDLNIDRFHLNNNPPLMMNGRSDDAGTYCCSGTNELGTVTTSAQLLVPGNKKGIRF